MDERVNVDQFRLAMRSLAGAGHELKEYAIGVEVFDRKPSYDPRVDPIVRVEARRLRSKLAAFYEAEGKGSDIVVSLPKGSYAPRFSKPGVTEEAPEEKEPPQAVEERASLTGGPQILVRHNGALSVRAQSLRGCALEHRRDVGTVTLANIAN